MKILCTVLVLMGATRQGTQLVITPRGADAHGSQKQVLAVLEKHASELAACYESKLPFVHASVQEIDLGFDVRDDGTVGTASVTMSTLGRADVESCFTSVMRGLRFGADFGKAQVKLSYPFVVNWPSDSAHPDNAPSAEVKTAARPTLTQAQIKKVLDDTNDKFRICYDRKVMKQHDFAFNAQLRMLIEATGVVSRAELKSSSERDASSPREPLRESAMRDDEVETCVIDVARRTRFPAVDKGGAVYVTLPFDYHAGAQPAASGPTHAPGCHATRA